MKKLIVSLAFLFPAMGMMAQTQVKTVEGILEGKDLSGIHVFKGVPFAAPPVGFRSLGGRAHGKGIWTEPDAGSSIRRHELRHQEE